jgi:hypothetical protein
MTVLPTFQGGRLEGRVETERRGALQILGRKSTRVESWDLLEASRPY